MLGPGAAWAMAKESANWAAVLALADGPDAELTHALALRALADRAEPEVVDGLIARLGREPDPGRRCQYADLLARVYKTPGPWVYWGYRPAPRPAGLHVLRGRAGVGTERATERGKIAGHGVALDPAGGVVAEELRHCRPRAQLLRRLEPAVDPPGVDALPELKEYSLFRIKQALTDGPTWFEPASA